MKSIIVITLAAGCAANLTPEPTEHDVSLPCLPNLDGRIDIDELPFPDDATGSYWISPANTTVDLVGTEMDDGVRRWDWSAVATADSLVDVQAGSMNGAWFATEFPRGELVVPLDLSHTVLGVLARDENAISLLGLVSVTPDPPAGKTLVHYDAPLALYVFPITSGAHWSSTGTVSPGRGTIDGLPFVGQNRFEITASAPGTLDLPDLTFTQAYQLRSTVTVRPDGGPSVSQHGASFVFECFGEVARATSREQEPSPDFRVAREVRRLSVR